MHFAKSFVINLPFKTDRLQKFLASVPACFGEIQVWPAVHGDHVRPPEWWKAGNGAWGCYRSHLQILEYCYQKDFESYVVLEDDAIFKTTACELIERFMGKVPSDWQQIYFGGQLLHETAHPPRQVNDVVYAPYNVNRTHCFAVHRRGYARLYQHLNTTPFAENEHIDHHSGRLHESGAFKVYCPGKWIVGQDGGPSNISGNHNAATYWPDPERSYRPAKDPSAITCVFLEAPIDVVLKLEERGWHRGHWQNDQRLDRGVCEAVASLDCRPGIRNWYRAVIPEAARQGSECVCLYHPSLSWGCVESMQLGDLIRVKCDSVEAAEKILKDHQNSRSSVAMEVIGAKRPKRNLIYHIWPKLGSEMWRWNVEQLLKRIDQFDGVRSIAVVTDGGSATLADVQEAFRGARVDNWIGLTNDPNLGEVASFQRLLETLPQDDSVTFYGHAKGVKYDGDNQNIRDWASIMYEVCLDNPNYVDASLSQFFVTGPFKNNREYVNQIKHDWHYSGTFYWFRNAELFKRDWQSIDQDYYGSEKYLGNLFTSEEAGDLFGGYVGWLYRASEMDRVRGMLEEWRKMAGPVDNIEDDRLKPRGIAPRCATPTIPVYINARNLLTPLRQMVAYLQKLPGARPIIVDNDSTWAPLLEWYETECPVEVIRTGINGGKFGWESHILDHAREGIEFYVVTDSDLILDGIPADVLDVLREGLQQNPDVRKVGLSLDLWNIPVEYQYHDGVIYWESKFWQQKHGRFWRAGIDTTFAMRRASDDFARETHNGLRADKPYTAIHWPWTWTPDVIAGSEEIQHYLATSKPDGLMWTAQQKGEFQPETSPAK